MALINPSTGAQLQGSTTNDNASAGNVGEFISSQGNNVSLTSTLPAAIATINLTPGDWDVWGTLQTNPAGTTTQSLIQACFNTAVAITTPPSSGGFVQLNFAIAAGLSQVVPIGVQRVSTASSITLGIVAAVTFAASTLTVTAFIAARRRR